MSFFLSKIKVVIYEKEFFIKNVRFHEIQWFFRLQEWSQGIWLFYVKILVTLNGCIDSLCAIFRPFGFGICNDFQKNNYIYKRGLVFLYNELKWQRGSQELTMNRDPWPQQLFISSAESDRFFANCCGSLVRRYALLKKVQDGPGRWLQNLSIAFWLLLIWWWLKVRTLWQFW